MRLDGRPVEAGEEDIFLADVEADPDERFNLAVDPDHAQVVARLSAMIDQHVAGSVEVPHEYVEGRKAF